VIGSIRARCFDSPLAGIVSPELMTMSRPSRLHYSIASTDSMTRPVKAQAPAPIEVEGCGELLVLLTPRRFWRSDVACFATVA
jgi:hypothetical protein